MPAESDFEALEARVSALEKAVAQMQGAPPAAPAAPPAFATFAPYEEAPLRTINLEAFFGGRFLLGAGVLVFLIGVAFFLKYAFDTGWIGPTGRVAIGLFCGTALIGAGELLQRRAQLIFAQSIAGLGAAVLYLSLWAAGPFFHLIPLSASFLAMTVVTAAVGILALKRQSVALLSVAMAGGYLTPALNSGGPVNLVALGTYLTLLNAALLIAVHRRWSPLSWAAFLAAHLYLIVSYAPLANGFPNAPMLVFTLIFAAQFSVAAFLRNREREHVQRADMVLLIVSAGTLFGELAWVLFDHQRFALAAACAAIASVYIAATRRAPGVMREVLAALCLSYVTLFVAVAFKANTLTALLTVEAAMLVIAGLRAKSVLVRGFGYAVYVFGLFSIAGDRSIGPPFLNERFLTMMIATGGIAAVAFQAYRLREMLPWREEYLPYLAESAAHFIAIIAVTLELADRFNGSELPISLLLLVYAAGLLTSGFMTNRSYARWQGLALFLALLVKVFTVDLASFDAIVRIVSFLAVGSVLLVVAFLYQRVRTRSNEA